MSVPSADLFEKTASFYLGRHFDVQQGKSSDDLVLYDSRDLCTHAMCVGMTGSGKTGLCISLLEEAALDGVPAICVDPKGDLANLLLTFPELRPEDFQPWLEEEEAKRKGITIGELAQQKSNLWREGLAKWGQSGDRIARLRAAVDTAIYTPGSNIGLPLTVLKRFDAPPPAARQDLELISDRVTGAASGLLTLMGIDADPVSSRPHILIASIFQQRWMEGRDVEIADLIRLIQKPPLERIGVLDLDSFMSADERNALAMRLNNMLASPAFAPWMEGEGLSIERLLYTETGQPRLSILSIAHLNDQERMFFVTLLLNELLAWTRSQRGTSSLRAMFYMDEVAGYFPPVSKPPSKPPMLTLLKQARAFGVGIMLATQNPVDLDYRGLSNIGTWFLGRLQTERDQQRVLAGLATVADQGNQTIDSSQMQQLLANLQSRVFVMNNVHDGFPTPFETRWAMSYLAGPLARDQISELMAQRKQPAVNQNVATSDDAKGSSKPATRTARPAVPAGITERFLLPTLPVSGGQGFYRPSLCAEATLRFVHSGSQLDLWRDVRWSVPVWNFGSSTHWGQREFEQGQPIPEHLRYDQEPIAGFDFAPLPDPLRSPQEFEDFPDQLEDFFYRHSREKVYRCELIKGDKAGTKAEAVTYFRDRLREMRDEQNDKLRDRYEDKVKSLEKKVRTAEARLAREKSQSRTSAISAASSFAGALIGAFLGGRRTRATTVTRGLGYAAQQHQDVRLAQEAIDLLERERKQLWNELQEDLRELGETHDLQEIPLEVIEVAPRKSDLEVNQTMILWLPWRRHAQGDEAPLY